METAVEAFQNTLCGGIYAVCEDIDSGDRGDYRRAVQQQKRKGVMRMVCAYARVSTADQNLDRQMDALEKYGIDRLYCEKVSGTKKSRPELDRMLVELQEGDTAAANFRKALTADPKVPCGDAPDFGEPAPAGGGEGRSRQKRPPEVFGCAGPGLPKGSEQKVREAAKRRNKRKRTWETQMKLQRQKKR